MSQLFSKFKLRDIEFKNRIFVSPMCQYSSREGLPTAWHMVHLGSRAVGGAGLVMVEATAVSPEGRISPGDSGIWSKAHADAFRPITDFIREQGAVPGVQLAHAGRKASNPVPWPGGAKLTPWTTQAPSAIAFEGYAVPHEMTDKDLQKVEDDFAAAIGFSREAGFDVIELQAAHGYLLHEFLSPLSNQRSDQYGGSLANRMRFPSRIAKKARELWPSHLPLFVRISATDWVKGGWDLESSVAFARELKNLGVDLIDCSSGGTAAKAEIPVAPGYQVPFAQAVRTQAGLPTGAVGMITVPEHAEEILANHRADVVFLARELLRDPYWPLHAAHTLGVDAKWPVQYERAKPKTYIHGSSK